MVKVMKTQSCLIGLLILISSTTVYSQRNERPSVGFQITTQQYQDGVVDDDRLFISDYYFIPKEVMGYESCYVMTTTVNNYKCSKTSIGGLKNFWLKTEVSNKEFSGDKFTCKLRQIDSTKWEFTIDEPIGMRDGNILHKVILKNDSKIKLSQVVDYKSTLTKYSDLTKKIENVVFKPIVSKGYDNWVGKDMGCKSMSIPVMNN
jgi:hypothetical protein